MPHYQSTLSTISQSSWWADPPWYLTGPLWKKVPSQGPVDEPPTKFSSRAPTENDVHPLSPPPHVLPAPQKGTPTNSSCKERCSLSGALQLSLNIPSQQTPQVPEGAPTERDTHLQIYLLHLYLKVPSKWAPLHVPQQGPYGEWNFISRANGLFLHLYLSESPIRSPPTKKTGKTFGHHPQSPMWTEGLHTVECGLIPQGDRLWHCSLYPSAMQPSAQYLPPWLG